MAGLVARRLCSFAPALYNNSSARRSVLCKPSLGSKRLLHFTRQLFADLKFTEKHEWMRVDDGVGTIGITDYAQDQLGDIVYVQLPDVGFEVDEGEPGEDITTAGEVAALESVKAASDVYSPAAGTVIEVNSQLEDDPGLVNRSSYEEGWLIKIKLSKPDSAQDELLNEEQYQQFLKESGDDH